MKHEDEEGLILEHLEDLIFYDEGFVYGEDCDYPYKHILSITYIATVIKKSINFVPTGTTYKIYLCLHLADKFNLRIEQERSFFGMKEKQKAEAVMRASALFHEITFTHRMEGYEKQLEEKGFISWGNYQFSKDGDLFKQNEFLFNLKDDDVKKTLNVFAFQAGKKPKGFKGALVKFWKGTEIIDISKDRDCFLYFMKNYLGYTWTSEPVKEKKKQRQHEFYEAILILGAKVCKADGRVDTKEIKTFKRYFGIDENSFPGASEIFTEATHTSYGTNNAAQKVYDLFEGKKEPLEHIVIGFLQIAATDGVITIDERRIIEGVCNVFKFSNEEIERLFLIFDSIRQEERGSEDSGFSSGHRIQYLKILGLGSYATYEEVKMAYKGLVKKHHPDILLAQGIPIERIKDSEEILKTINAAYNWLSNDANQKKRCAF